MLRVFGLVGLFLFLSACNRVVPPPTPPPPGNPPTTTSTNIELEEETKVVLSILPTSADLRVGQTVTFTISVVGVEKSKVTIKVKETNGGSISPAGLYEAPSVAGTYHIVVSYLEKSAEATVRVRSPVRDISVGGGHACAIWGDTLKCWGAGGQGQLGTGETFGMRSPTTTLFPGAVSSVASSWDRSCGISTSGKVYCWGLNDLSQSGTQSVDYSILSPLEVSGVTGAVQLSLSNWHACVVTKSGELYCWGISNIGMGTGKTEEPFAKRITSVTDASMAAVGWDHFCVLLGNGGVECWGRNNNGQLGTGSYTPQDYPTPVSGLSSGVVKIVAGDDHTCALIVDGTVVCWGENGYGQLGDASDEHRNYPVAVNGLSAVSDVSAGVYSTCAVASGTTKCWGQNLSGVLGTGTDIGPESCLMGACSKTPTSVALSTSVLVSTGLGNACAITVEGALYCWGDNYSGEIGDGTIGAINGPTLVP